MALIQHFNAIKLHDDLNNQILLSPSNYFYKIGITYNEKDSWFNKGSEPYEQYRDLIFTINNTTVQVGRTDMYETPEPISGGGTIYFPDYPPSIQVNLCVLLKGEDD